jgi:hypothetical protein
MASSEELVSQAFYKLTVAQRNQAWMEVEELKEQKRELMRRCLEAERFDAQFENSRLPGDSALAALLASFEEALARE